MYNRPLFYMIFQCLTEIQKSMETMPDPLPPFATNFLFHQTLNFGDSPLAALYNCMIMSNNTRTDNKKQ